MNDFKYLLENFLLAMVFCGLVVTSQQDERQLETFINPNCGELCDENSTSNLVYTKSVGESDVFHYLWSTIGAPTFLVARTSKTSKLVIHWDELLNDTTDVGSISFTESPTYASAVILSKLIEFDDDGDSNYIGSSVVDLTPMELIKWEKLNETNINTTSHCQVTFHTKLNCSDLFMPDGQLSIQVNTHGNEDHSDLLPRLPFSSNSSEIRLTLYNLQPQLNNSRYGFEIITINTEVSNKDWAVSQTDTINDEYTPGVFKTVHITSPAVESGFGSYLMWKPVTYTSDALTVIESSDVNLYDNVKGSASGLPSSIARSFFVNATENLISQFNITFGTKEDGFYKKTHYAVWTFSSGIGTPQNEKFSLLVIMVLASGLGLPLLIMISSTVYIFVHKYRKRPQTSSVNSPLNFN